MNPTNEKKFDCLAYKDEAQTRIFEETKDMTREQFQDFLRQRVEQGPFAEFWKSIPKRRQNRRRVA